MIYKLKCDMCGERVDRRRQWIKVVCFECKEARHRRVSKRYMRRKSAVPDIGFEDWKAIYGHLNRTR